MGTVSGRALSRVARNAAFCLCENTFRNSFPFGLIAFDIVSIGYILHPTRRKQPTGNETMTTATTTQCECFKCGGSGYIQEFSGIAQGVCFTCNGSGKLTVKQSQKATQELPEEMRIKADWILASTYETFSGFSMNRMSAVRNFAHSYCVNIAAATIYGKTVHTAFFDQGGEEKYQELAECRRQTLDQYSL